jgi:hypothetical protein
MGGVGNATPATVGCQSAVGSRSLIKRSEPIACTSHVFKTASPKSLTLIAMSKATLVFGAVSRTYAHRLASESP